MTTSHPSARAEAGGEPRAQTSAEIPVSRVIADVSVLRLAPASVCRVTTVPLLDGVELLSWHGRFAQPVDVPLHDDSDRIHFSFTNVLRGSALCSFDVGSRREDYPVCEGTGNVSFGSGHRGRFRQQGDLENITVMVRPDVFAGWMQDSDATLRQSLDRDHCFLEGHRGDELRATAQALGQSLASFDDPAGGGLRHRLWLQAQGMALVSLFLEARHGTEHRHARSLGNADQSRVLRARDLLLADLARAPTLAELAQASGLSVPTLERGFRQCFGNSVYGTFQQARMHAARQRLLAGGVSVTTVAVDLGYTNTSHFAAAFRKQLGVNPSSLKVRGTPTCVRTDPVYRP